MIVGDYLSVKDRTMNTLQCLTMTDNISRCVSNIKKETVHNISMQNARIPCSHSCLDQADRSDQECGLP